MSACISKRKYGGFLNIYAFVLVVNYYQIKGPSGDQIHDFRNKISGKYEFVVHNKGVYSFCFYNKSPYPETLDFDIKVWLFADNVQLAKDDLFSVVSF